MTAAGYGRETCGRARGRGPRPTPSHCPRAGSETRKVAGIPAGAESNPLKQTRRGRIAEPTRAPYGQPGPFQARRELR